jgi:colanic acid biosynthesis glycosyl transferase WcaI
MMPHNGKHNLNVLIVTQYFWPEDFRINDFALSLAKCGHSVTVLTGKPNYPQGSFFSGYGWFRRSREDFNGVDVLRVPLIPRGNGGGLRLSLNYLSFALCAIFLAPFVCKGKFDLILVYQPSPITVGLPAIFLKSIKRCPIMFWVQDLWPESLSATGAINSKLILTMIGRMVRFIYSRCDCILVQSQAFRAPIADIGIAIERIIYFPNSAEDLYQPMTLGPTAPEPAGIPKGFRVMFAGNIGAAQDFETILQAAELLKHNSQIQWIILGEGRLFPWLKDQVVKRELESQIHLMGRHPVESMPTFFALADAMLVTLRDDPIFSLTIPAKIQSYLACGKPIIAGLNGEGARIVEESGGGITSPAQNPVRLAEAVLAMSKMALQHRLDMGVRGRRYFEENFERGVLISQFEQHMDRLIGGRI